MIGIEVLSALLRAVVCAVIVGAVCAVFHWAILFGALAAFGTSLLVSVVEQGPRP